MCFNNLVQSKWKVPLLHFMFIAFIYWEFAHWIKFDNWDSLKVSISRYNYRISLFFQLYWQILRSPLTHQGRTTRQYCVTSCQLVGFSFKTIFNGINKKWNKFFRLEKFILSAPILISQAEEESLKDVIFCLLYLINYFHLTRRQELFY